MKRQTFVLLKLERGKWRAFYAAHEGLLLGAMLFGVAVALYLMFFCLTTVHEGGAFVKAQTSERHGPSRRNPALQSPNPHHGINNCSSSQNLRNRSPLDGIRVSPNNLRASLSLAHGSGSGA